MSSGKLTDLTVELPAYMRAYEKALADWQKLRQTPMPHPQVPKIAPDEVQMMPMRDGDKLYTELYFPARDASRVPTVLIRTPYPDATFPFSARPIELFRSAGYAVAIQSCRGTWRSEGRFRFMQNEPEDGFDCIEIEEGGARDRVDEYVEIACFRVATVKHGVLPARVREPDGG